MVLKAEMFLAFADVSVTYGGANGYSETNQALSPNIYLPDHYPHNSSFHVPHFAQNGTIHFKVDSIAIDMATGKQADFCFEGSIPDVVLSQRN